ncbi:helix-turn-helix transcriptional regulator [Brevibacterium oceani]|uniref:helix-turn-helix transcriptional regulator n=1 Tax=Brevibacterium oceani TaxID=358099 RepID=UPI0015E66766|nr:helix-turn-helix transcriptional regulator [Brevibacterium oceani]
MSAVRSDDLVRAPHPRLRPFVGDYVGYDISGVPAGTHLGLPSGALAFIVAIDEPLCQVDPGTGESESFDVLLAGLHLRSTLIRHSGTMAGIQINFGPFAPRALFGIPAADFAHRTYDLDVVSRPLAAELHDRVNAAQSWPCRFDAIDDVLIRCLGDRRNPRAEVVESWRQIAVGRGGLPVSLIADRIGWSRRHLASQFRSELGIGPKDASRVLRFDRARRLIAVGRVPLAEIAATCGYADQSHLNRDFRALTGTSPQGWLRGDDVARLSAVDDSVVDNHAAHSVHV